MPDALHVLVIDDSAVVREALTRLLVRQGGMRVSVASDPIIATERIRADRPDVIVLDLEMPRMDGLTFLRAMMASDPIPTIVCSGFAQAGSEMAIRALEAGAVEVIAKAQLGVRSALEANAGALIEAVRAAARARIQPRPSRVARGDPSGAPAQLPPLARGAPTVPGGRASPRRAAAGGPSDRVVVIGASTGGVMALTAILRSLPANAPGIIVVQHMPQGFTAALARHLDANCLLHVVEARRGDRLMAGRVLVAPGGTHHMRVRREGASCVTELLDGPRVNGHRPSVDVLFHAVAAAAGGSAMGILLTGMGSDGAAGLRALREAGAETVAQDEGTSVVFGMPAEAIRLGGAGRVLPLEQIAGAIGRFASG